MKDKYNVLTRFKKTVLLGMLMIAVNVAMAQSGRTKLTKNLSKDFSVEKGTNIEISNKYGQVIVNTWEYDSVVVDIEVSAYGRNDDAVEKLMDRVDFEFNNFGDFLTIETILDRKSGFFKEIMNNIGDYSKTLLSKNKINIDYEITIPEKSTLNLENKFGNVYVNTLTGTSKIRVAHGDFKANELSGTTKLYLSFGKGNIKSIENGFLELKGSEIDIRYADNIDVESSTSRIQLDKVTSLKLNSRNDKIRIEEGKFLRGRSGFSNIIIDSMIDNANMELNYGEFIVNRISPNFSKVQLAGKSADINMNFDLDAYFALDLVGKSDNIFLSRNMDNLDKTVDQENDKFITLEGDVGQQKGKKSLVVINAQGGDVYLYAQEAGAITKDN